MSHQEKKSEKKIAFQGTFGANSHLACRDNYPNYQAVPCDSFIKVFDLVANNEVDYGMIPLENSYAGRVSEIHNLLQDSNLSIVAEHFLQVEHCLVSVADADKQSIQDVYSHPQALMQCKDNLAKNHYKLHNFSNTAEAAKFVASQNDKSKAAICSELAAELHNLQIIEKKFQDAGNDNITVFVVISKKAFDPDPAKGRVITTMLFTVRNIPGALYKALGGFATNNVNMIKLESYIPGGISAQAKFFISIEGHPSQRSISLSLEELGFFSKSVKVLGVYYADPQRFDK